MLVLNLFSLSCNFLVNAFKILIEIDINKIVGKKNCKI
jgi:hypothetical protein